MTPRKIYWDKNAEDENNSFGSIDDYSFSVTRHYMDRNKFQWEMTFVCESEVSVNGGDCDTKEQGKEECQKYFESHVLSLFDK
jgi:hypothetical protein